MTTQERWQSTFQILLLVLPNASPGMIEDQSCHHCNPNQVCKGCNHCLHWRTRLALLVYNFIVYMWLTKLMLYNRRWPLALYLLKPPLSLLILLLHLLLRFSTLGCLLMDKWPSPATRLEGRMFWAGSNYNDTIEPTHLFMMIATMWASLTVNSKPDPILTHVKDVCCRKVICLCPGRFR